MTQVMVNTIMKKHVDDDCKVRCVLMNPIVGDEFGQVEIVNERMHASISHHRVDENYVDDTCGLFFEMGIDYVNMENVVFAEELEVEVVTVTTSSETKVGTSHEVARDLAATNDQEHDKVIEEF